MKMQGTTAMLLITAMLSGGCMMPAKTKVTKDGFMARQKTTEKHRAIVEDYDLYRTTCRYDQLAKDPSDGQYYCPGDGTKEGYNSHVELAQYMESVLDKWGPKVLQAGAFVGSAGLIMHGLQTQAVSPGTTINQGGNSISTLVGCGAGKAFNTIQGAPGCK